MGRAPCCAKVGLQRGPWTPKEDALLLDFIQANGEGHWRSLPTKAGLLGCGKSCRLRWMNYLRPDIKRGNITQEEEDLIVRLHGLLGNRWSLIAGRLPGRTDNEIKNYWNTNIVKKNHNRQNNKTISRNPTRTTTSSVEKPKLHKPKPVRLNSLSLITRNNSIASFESDGSGGTRASWPSGDGGVSLVADQGVTEEPRASDDVNMELDRLCEEYMQLIRTDDDFRYDFGLDVLYDTHEFDSFAGSSMLI